MTFIKHNSSGFTLPVVLLLSLFIIMVIASNLASSTTFYSVGYVDHYQKLADEAAEAGTAFASSCLVLSDHVQTWGPAKGLPNLQPKTDCNGATSYPANAYIHSDSTVRTYFSVGDLDYAEAYSSQISATGYAEVLKSDGTVAKTYTSVTKKVSTWNKDVGATMSVAGTNRTCAIVGGKVYCWGYNRYGQLGNGQHLEQNVGTYYWSSAAPGYDSLTPVKVVQAAGVMAGKTMVKIFAEAGHSCALSSDGQMFCWGVNYSGQLGDGTLNDSDVPVKVGGALAGKVITDIGGSNSASCAIAEKKIYCWGQNWLGQTGVGYTSAYVATPTLVQATNTSTTLSSSYQATALSTSGSQSGSMCGIADNKAYCWGQNEQGEIGDGTFTNRSLPTKVYDGGVLAGKTVTAISQDGFSSSSDRWNFPLVHVCAVASGAVYCWGENYWSQLGNYALTTGPTPGYSNIPVATDLTGTLWGAGVTVKDVAVGLGHSCALTTTGVSCWGKNNFGQVGTSYGGYTWWYNPQTVDQLPGGLTSSNVVSIGSGANRGCAVITDGRSFCWGLNDAGQIGDGTTVNRFQPTDAIYLRPADNKFIF